MAKASTSKGIGRVTRPVRTYDAKPYKAKRGAPSTKLTRDQLLELYRWMMLTRKLEERLVNLYRQNQVVGGLYRSLGQEAETIAAVYALEPQDIVGPLIRNMGAVLLRGYKPRDIAMQYMARAGGPSRGKDLNIHFGTVPEPGVAAPISMLGDMIPVMAGIALASKLKGEDRAALAFLGDGGTSTGAFYEGMNLAAVWKLPLIVIVENNGYAYSTPTHRQMAVDQIADKAKGLGCFGETVDGNHALAVYDAMVAARKRAVQGKGPTLLEVMTYRRKGHAEHDMQKYVPNGEIDWWARNNDPLDRFEALLVDGGHATRDELETLLDGIREELEVEFDAAFASPLPEPEIALEDVYGDPPRTRDHLAPYRTNGGGR